MYFHDNYYSLSEIFKLAYSLVLTRLFYPGAMLVRRPIYVRGKPRLVFGKGFTTGYNCRLEMLGERGDLASKLVFGDNCHLGDSVHIVAAKQVIIGNNCLMASKIFISDCSHGDYGSDINSSNPESDPNKRPLSAQQVSIGKNVWIGENVCILKGVTIGDGVIVGANSVVTKNIPSFAVVGGIPARILKTYHPSTGTWENTAK